MMSRFQTAEKDSLVGASRLKFNMNSNRFNILQSIYKTFRFIFCGTSKKNNILCVLLFCDKNK